MNGNEKMNWAAQLWLSSMSSILMLGVLIGDGEFQTPMGAAFLWFGITFVAWLFRLTYLAGKRNS